MTNDTDKILSEAADRIRREAYAAGWRAAVEAITKAAKETAPGEVTEGDFDLGSASTRKTNLPGDPKEGTTPWVIMQMVRRKPGMKGSEIVAAVQESGHKASDASIRTSIGRLNGKLIVSRHTKWYLK